jgi:hypothetical protein
VQPARILLAVLLVIAVLIVVFATGWADDRAKPGSTGRAPVSSSAP